ncbi:MAG: NAD-dependent epimerase/dehydratase family protein [Deltaproteobacteria bacterium]|nr:NAD-dependent epimerase/dehydratase family protein [Nannocystaceae bacterium]
MRVIVTGGAGFIGSHVVDALLDEGHEVVVVDDLSSGRERNLNAKARFERVDIVDAAALERTFAAFEPEVVCHQAAQTSVSVSTREPVRDASTNVIGSINVLEACVRHRVGRLIFASTGGAIYGEVAEPKLAKVGDATVPLSPYACSKLAVEHYIACWQAAHGLHATVLRYANVYGPRQDPHGEAGVVAIFSERLLSALPCRINAKKDVGDDGCIRDYVAVADVVKANLLAVHGKLGDTTINVCTGVPATTLQIAEGLMKSLAIEASLERGPWRPGDLERSVLDATEMRTKIGEPTSLDVGLARTAKWFREQHDALQRNAD